MLPQPPSRPQAAPPRHVMAGAASAAPALAGTAAAGEPGGDAQRGRRPRALRRSRAHTPCLALPRRGAALPPAATQRPHTSPRMPSHRRCCRGAPHAAPCPAAPRAPARSGAISSLETVELSSMNAWRGAAPASRRQTHGAGCDSDATSWPPLRRHPHHGQTAAASCRGSAASMLACRQQWPAACVLYMRLAMSVSFQLLLPLG